MSARVLHDLISAGMPSQKIIDEGWQIILRALDLLVAVEESEYEMVLDLLAAAKLHRLAICYKAAAALVAMKAAKEKAEAELDSLKQHTEAMASDLASLNYGPKAALDAYRAAHPKEGA